MTKNRKERIYALLRQAGIEDTQTIDVDAYFDSSLSFVENVQILSGILGKELLNKTEREAQLRAEQETADERTRKDYEAQVSQAEAQAIKQIIDKNVNLMDEYFGVPRSLIKTVALGYSDNLILTGEGGLGKTHAILSTLSELGMRSDEDFKYHTGYLTPLALFHALYENREKINIFDDVEGLLGDIKASSILKSAMWSTSGPKVVQYKTTSKALEAPSQFIFSGRIMVCTNTIPRKNDEGLKALLSRSLCYEFKLSWADKLRILATIATHADYRGMTLEQRMEVFNFIKEHSDETTENCNVRTLMKGYDLYRFGIEKNADWKKPLDEMLERNESLKVLKDIMDTYDTTKEQVREFCQQTGMSAMTYYRYKKKLSYEVRSKIPAVPT